MKIMMGALLALYCGVVAGAECTSPPAVVWTDASGSLLWKTARETPIKVSVDWPKGAASATLSIAKCGTQVASAELLSTAVRVYPLAFDFPEKESDEAVVDMTLTFRDSSSAVLDGETRTASVGLVRGVEGRPFRLIPSSAAVRKWQQVRGSAVAPVPESAVSAALDGLPLAFTGAPGWLYLSGMPAGEHTLALDVDDGDPLSVPLFGIGGLIISFK